MPSRSLGRDWCVSRQLWWGHRIPAYLVVEEHMKVGRTKRMGGLGIAEREVATAQESERASSVSPSSLPVLGRDPTVGSALPSWHFFISPPEGAGNSQATRETVQTP